MATILSSKSFNASTHAKLPGMSVDEWLLNIEREHGSDNYCINVTLETSNNIRRKKVTAMSELESMAVDVALENKDVWSNGKYKFCFLSKKYFWKKQEIYLTANEQLFLFRWLVLKDEIHKRQTYYLRNMRKRLGKEFLTELRKGKK